MTTPARYVYYLDWCSTSVFPDCRAALPERPIRRSLQAVALVLFCATAVDALGGLPPPTATHVLDLPRAVFDEEMSEDMPDPPFGRNILKTSTPASGNAHSLLPGHDKPVITPIHGETVRTFKGKAHSPASVPAHREANHALSHGEEKHTLVYGEAKHAPVYGKANRSPGHSKEEEDAGDDDDDDDDAEHASVHGKGNHVSGHGHHSMTRLERKVLVKKFARMREHFEHAKHKARHDLHVAATLLLPLCLPPCPCLPSFHGA